MPHYHCEIILPPTDDIEADIASIFKPFYEGDEKALHPFWDYYRIGGRWSAAKEKSLLDPEKLESFYEWLKSKGFMVHGFQTGKQEFADRKTEQAVHAKWVETFPNAGPHCALFKHGDQGRDPIRQDVAKLAAISDTLTASRVIIGGPSYDGELEATYMVETEYWNGVNYTSTVWDGNVLQAVKDCGSVIENYTEKYQATHTPQPDWLVITVDYHS